MRYAKVVVVSAAIAALVGFSAQAQNRPYAEGHAPQVNVRADASPFKTIYIVPGVLDSGDNNEEGFATSISCINYSTTTATVQFLFWRREGTLISSTNLTLPALATATASTHWTNLF